jgi:hypothetical protein
LYLRNLLPYRLSNSVLYLGIASAILFWGLENVLNGLAISPLVLVRHGASLRGVIQERCSDLSGVLKRLLGQMRVPLGGLDLGMSEEVPDNVD